MVVLKLPKNRLIGPSIKILIGPVLIICMMIVLSFVSIKTGYKQINLQLENLRSYQKTERILEEKIFILRQIQEGVLEYTNTSVSALPEKNPAPVIISQLKTFSANSSIFLDKIQLGGGASASEDGVFKGKLEIEAENVEEAVMLVSFINTLSKILPLLTIDQVEMDGFGEELSLKLTASYYWSTFPTQLPPITEPIKDLLPNERVLLSELSGFLKPSFTVLQPSSPRERINPFN
jgi:hypothetical protein